MSDNPYASPQADAEAPADRELYAAVAREFGRSRPWVLACAIWCFLKSGIIATLICLIVMHGEEGVFSGFILGVVALVMLVAGTLLLRISRSMQQYAHQSTQSELEYAMMEQNSFWTYSGYTMLVVIGLFLLAALNTVISVLDLA